MEERLRRPTDHDRCQLLAMPALRRLSEMLLDYDVEYEKAMQIWSCLQEAAHDGITHGLFASAVGDPQPFTKPYKPRL